jgi:hypothetical protein
MAKGFLFAEDAALKLRFSNIFVNDDRDNSRPLNVFFRYPEKETEKYYPFITLERVAIAHATNRQESERFYYYTGDSSYPRSEFSYFPSELNPTEVAALANGGRLRKEAPVPVNITYLVTTYARNPIHDVQITATMLRSIIPFRRGFIEIPEDGTVRRLDLLQWQQSDITDQEAGQRKRIFRKVFTLVMNAEIPTSELSAVFAVDQVNGEIIGTTDLASTVPSSSIVEDF